MVAVVRRAALLDRPGLWDVRVGDNGLIAEVVAANRLQEARLSSSEVEWPSHCRGSEIDAGGRLLLPGFVDAHVHLDKAHIHCRCRAETGDFAEALAETLAAKRDFTREDIYARASRVVDDAVASGTTLLRTHAEVDDILGLTAVEALLDLRSRYQDEITIQVAAFAQEGITNIAGEVDLLRAAVRLGCDVVGSAPYTDSDGHANIRCVFDIAQEFDIPVDFHLDYHLGDEKPSLLAEVLSETHRRGWHGRVCLGHMTALSSLAPGDLVAVAQELRQARVSVLALPASDIYMMARGDCCNQRRGVAPVHRLGEAGVCAAFATNNVQNLFTFTGDGDVLKVATLLAQLLQLGSRESHRRCLEMATSVAASAIGVEHQLEAGHWADLVLLDCTSATAALAAPPVARVVLKRGKVVACTTKSVQRPGRGRGTPARGRSAGCLAAWLPCCALA